MPYDRYALRLVKPIYRKLVGKPTTTGFKVWFESLVKALRQAGQRVVINDAGLARRHPKHPVGLVGYPVVLETYRLPNPTVLGPGLYDHPKLAPRLFDDPRHRAYIVTCTWMRDLFARYWGDRLRLWHGGIDLTEWPDRAPMSKTAKAIDFLVYDKVRWNRDQLEPQLVNPLLDELRRRGLTFEVVRYGHYQQADYRQQLGRARGMLFLCEHETQGMAYQEALASNVPVLAWENGFWLDPKRATYEAEPVPASSVPYFSDECGVRFTDAQAFPTALENFQQSLPNFRPRGFVERELSLRESARRYLEVYRGI